VVLDAQVVIQNRAVKMIVNAGLVVFQLLFVILFFLS
jgi:hypothetical protein